jgi:hypothetical protein
VFEYIEAFSNIQPPQIAFHARLPLPQGGRATASPHAPRASGRLNAGVSTARCARVRSFARPSALAALALDDLGTGFGSFTHLQRLPVRYLKIDIEFVRDLTTNTANQQLVKAIVNLAKGIEQETIAKGVEDAQTLELLIEFGVDYAHGSTSDDRHQSTTHRRPEIAGTQRIRERRDCRSPRQESRFNQSSVTGAGRHAVELGRRPSA